MLLTMHYISNPLINTLIGERFQIRGKQQKAVDLIKKRRGLLFYEGDQLDKLFLLLDGQVMLFKSDKEGQQIPILSLEKGDFIGLNALCQEGLSSHSAWVAKASKLLVIPSRTLPNIMEKWPGLRQKIVHQLIKYSDRLELSLSI